MSFNFSLAKELYGQPWCMDSHSLPGLLGTLAMIRQGVNLEIPTVKYNTPELFNILGEAKGITSPWQLENNDDFKGIGIININGPITVNGGNSTIGMIDLSNMMMEMSMDSRIVGFIIKADSGGGASSAVDIMVDTINEIKQRVPVYGLVRKGGMAASAMYMILTACNGIYCESGMSIIGSNGTMIQFDGKAANSTDSEGNKNIRLYASKSTMKNKDFEEALNNDNYELIINELLDPVNEHGLARSLANRPLLEGTNYDNGHIVFAKNAIGTFIDGIASFNQVVDMVMAESAIMTNTNSVNNNNSNSKKMTREELKNQHPELFNSVFAEGVASEKDRAGSWMVFASADIKAVSAGIESGKGLSQTDMANLTVKMNATNLLQDLKSDNAPGVDAPESAAGKEKEDSKKAEIASAMDFKL